MTTKMIAAMLMLGACATDVRDDDSGLVGDVGHGTSLRYQTLPGNGDGTTGAVARFTDENDRTIAMSFFGHVPPADWVATLPDIAADDPSRLALATIDFDALDVPADMEAHRRALELTARAVPAVLEMESRIDTAPEENAVAMDALEPDLQQAIVDYYSALAPEQVVRRAFTLTVPEVSISEDATRAQNCRYYDYNYRHRTLLGNTAFRFHQWRNWCYDNVTHRMTGPGSRGSYASSVDPNFVYNGYWVNQDYWNVYPTQHVYQTQGSFQNCILKYGCIGTVYPWIRGWADGWGSSTYQSGR